jgi:hypothetical protein
MTAEEPLDRTECRVIDDGGPQLDVVESSIPGITPQALMVRVGPVFDNGKQRDEPGIWVEYQASYYESDVSGPVLLTPAAWEQLAACVDDRLSSRWNVVTRAERFTRAVRAVHRRYKEVRAEVNSLRAANGRLEDELRRCRAVIREQCQLVELAEDVLRTSGRPVPAPWARPSK